MSQKNIKLIDTNIIIRFLIGDSPEHLEKAEELFIDIESDKEHIVILESVFAEVVFVLLRVYNVEKKKIVILLNRILALKGVKNRNKTVLKDALEIFYSYDVDIVDAILCAYKNSNTEIISFDKKITSYKKSK